MSKSHKVVYGPLFWLIVSVVCRFSDFSLMLSELSEWPKIWRLNSLLNLRILTLFIGAYSPYICLCFSFANLSRRRSFYRSCLLWIFFLYERLSPGWTRDAWPPKAQPLVNTSPHFSHTTFSSPGWMSLSFSDFTLLFEGCNVLSIFFLLGLICWF